MSTQADQYFADHASSDTELARLSGLCKIYDTWTQDAFIKAGLKPDSRVAEIGFGTGSILRWLSSQIHAQGAVHGYDLTPRFIGPDKTFLEQSHVALYDHNIQHSALPEPHYDFVYTRLLLAHLFDPKQAMVNMMAGLKPGGKLIALDYNSLVVRANETSERANKFNQAVDAMNQQIGAQGLISASYGAEMAEQMREIGLGNISDEVMSRHHVGGDFESLLSAQGVELLGQARPETREFANILAATMRTPGFAYRDTDMHCTIGTKT